MMLLARDMGAVLFCTARGLQHLPPSQTRPAHLGLVGWAAVRLARWLVPGIPAGRGVPLSCARNIDTCQAGVPHYKLVSSTVVPGTVSSYPALKETDICGDTGAGLQ